MDEAVRTKSSVRNRYVLLGDLLLIAIIVIGSFAITSGIRISIFVLYAISLMDGLYSTDDQTTGLL